MNFFSLLLILTFLSLPSWGEHMLPFKIFLTKEKVKVSENYGTFKFKRKVKKVCYPEKISPVTSKMNRVLFPTCKVNLDITYEPVKSKWTFNSRESIEKNNYFVNIIFKNSIDEKFYGLGTQYTHLLLNGKKIEAISQEQGNGRGLQPISSIQRVLTPGIQGTTFSTYHANGLIHSSKGRTFLIKTDQFIEFDFKLSDRFKIVHQGLQFELRTSTSENIRESLNISSRWIGKQDRLPNWFHKAPIIGLMNAQKPINRIDTFLQQPTRPSAFWLQDWVGTRDTILGPRLKWDWRLDQGQYPNWFSMRRRLESKNQYLMGYFNPYLSIIEDRHGRGLYEEALKKGFLFSYESKIFLVKMGGFDAALVNLLDPDAYNWLKGIMKEQIRKTGMKGWMADFGEAFPYVENSFIKHHQYIKAWSKLNQEVRLELSKEGLYDLVAFHRSASGDSTHLTSAMWLGDQTTTYDNYDGLQSSVTGLLSSGLSSIAYNHSDIGGYFGIKIPFITNISRSTSLLKRWLEVNAFTMIFRSHTGLNPKLFSQLDSNQQTLKLYNYYGALFKKLYDYRLSLIDQYNESGLPPVRPLFVSYPDDLKTYTISDQFMLGDYILVSPIFSDTAKERKLYLPRGSWVNLWSGDEVNSLGKWITIKTFNNKSPIFYRKHPKLRSLQKWINTDPFQD